MVAGPFQEGDGISSQRTWEYEHANKTATEETASRSTAADSDIVPPSDAGSEANCQYKFILQARKERKPRKNIPADTKSRIRDAYLVLIMEYVTQPSRSVPVQVIRDIRDGRFMEYDDKQLTDIVRNLVKSTIRRME